MQRDFNTCLDRCRRLWLTFYGLILVAFSNNPLWNQPYLPTKLSHKKLLLATYLMFHLHVTCSCLWMHSHMPNPVIQTTLYNLGNLWAEQDSDFTFSFLICERGFWKASSPMLRELWNPCVMAMRSRQGILAPTSMLVLHTYDVHMFMHLILSNITKSRQFLYLYLN